MAWPSKPTADEVIGMSADELKQKLEGSATKDDIKSQLDGLKTEFSSSLNELRESLKNLNPITRTPEPDPVDPTTQVLVDPQAFVAAQTEDIRNMGLETQAQVMEMRARQGQYANVFAQYGDDLLKKANGFPLKQRAMPGFWDTYIRTFLGDQVVRGEIKSQYPSLIGSSSIGVNASGSTPDPNRNLAPQIVEYLNERHVPLDKAARLQSLMSDGEPITLANYKAAGNA